jgi:DNA-binding response OmpR family regulator
MAHVVAVVDDEEDLREAVADYLSGHGFRVLTAADAAALRSLAATESIDAVILDIAMPGEDGLSLARWLRRNTRAGIIFASASGSAMDRIVGLEIGGDDYLAKPYDLRELLARLRSLIRRLPAAPEPQAPVAPRQGSTAVATRIPRFGVFTLDTAARRLVHAETGPVDLTAAEYDLIEALATRLNRVLSRSYLAELLGSDDTGAGDRRIDVRVTRLRRKIELDPEQPRYLRTVRGEGYVLTGGEGDA